MRLRLMFYNGGSRNLARKEATLICFAAAPVYFFVGGWTKVYSQTGWGPWSDFLSLDPLLLLYMQSYICLSDAGYNFIYIIACAFVYPKPYHDVVCCVALHKIICHDCRPNLLTDDYGRPYKYWINDYFYYYFGLLMTAHWCIWSFWYFRAWTCPKQCNLSHGSRLVRATTLGARTRSSSEK